MADGISISAFNSGAPDLMSTVKSSMVENAIDEKMTERDIITDIQKNKNGTVNSAKDLANQYGISLSRAEGILNKLEASEEKDKIVEDYLTENALTHGAVLDNPPPEDSTISYHV